MDVRIIAATNRDLEKALSLGRFREDLYYRLKVVTIWLPPLRDRCDDVPLLARYFLARCAANAAMANPGILDEAIVALKHYPWPGNVREMQNAIQKTLIFNRGAPVAAKDIAQAISEKGHGGSPTDGMADDETIRKWVREALRVRDQDHIFDACMDRFAGLMISEALNITGGNRSQAAKLLGLSRPTLHSKIDKYHLTFKTSVKEG